MSTSKIEKSRWEEYFDHLSNVTDAQLVTIEVVGLAIGDQVQAENVTFDGVSYDAANDVIVVQAGELEHMVQQPVNVFVLEEDSGLKSMEITDAEENKHILTFKPATSG